ncbi:MAG: hypothetical protein LBP22_02085 [Deltaproteobacteria bacterium]|nr:hypothetical protein [Deltaproteobacteria bacterium]
MLQVTAAFRADYSGHRENGQKNTGLRPDLIKFSSPGINREKFGLKTPNKPIKPLKLLPCLGLELPDWDFCLSFQR